jgi:NAD(P)-dependent dehydrogenase (short-subunit alcohol dehydrogenase family)
MAGKQPHFTDMDIFTLSNKVVVITGAVGLLGKQHAWAVAEAGGTPVLLDLSQKALDDFAAEINSRFSCNCRGFAVDITHEDSVKKVCDDVLLEYGKIDGLINNAANNPKMETNATTNFSRLENFPLNTWNNDLAVGLTGSYLCIKYFGAAMAGNRQGGSIINVSSDLGLIAPDQRLYKDENVPANQQPVKPVTYSVVKTGLIGLTRYVSTYWADVPVRCNAICPGGVENGQPSDFIKEVTARIPMGRMARKDEYKGLIVFLLSEASSYINGAVIAADGGRTAW